MVTNRLNRTEQGDVGGAAAQESLLKIIEGTTVEFKDPKTSEDISVDTRNITFVGLGAFEGLDDMSPAGLKSFGLNTVSFKLI